MQRAQRYFGLLSMVLAIGSVADASAESRVQEARAHGYRYRHRGRGRLRPPMVAEPPAPASEPADRFELEFIIGGERLAGAYAFSDVRTIEPATRVESSGGMVNVLTGSSLGAGGFMPFAMPRVGFDLVAMGLSAGVCAGYSSSAGDERRESGSMRSDADLGSVGVWLLSPRIGYLHRFGPVVGLWPRAGMTFVWMNAEAPESGAISARLLNVSLEPMLVLSPEEHVAILVGPSFDIGLSGSNELTTPDGTVEADRRLSSFGASAGLALVF